MRELNTSNCSFLLGKLHIKLAKKLITTPIKSFCSDILSLQPGFFNTSRQNQHLSQKLHPNGIRLVEKARRMILILKFKKYGLKYQLIKKSLWKSPRRNIKNTFF